MIGQTFKTEPKGSVETQVFLNTIPRNDSTKVPRKKIFSKFFIYLSLIIILTTLILLNVTVLFIVLNKNIKIQNMQDEIDLLKHDVGLLKYRFLDDELVKEISDFEKESDLYSYADEDETNDKNSEPNFDDIIFDDYYDDDLNSDEVINKNEIPNSDDTASMIKKSQRSKREVLAATLDGVPIISESYAERKQRNKTLLPNRDELKLYETLGKNTEEPPRHSEHRRRTQAHKTIFTTGWAAKTYVNSGGSVPVLPGPIPTPVMSRSSRVMHTDEDKSKAFRKVVKKSHFRAGSSKNNQRNLQALVENTPATETSRPGHKHLRRKKSNIELIDERNSRMRPVAHYSGNTSKYIHGTHHHYRGNGHLAHPQGHYVDWSSSHWVRALGMDKYFHMHNGILTVKEPGLYFIYAQIYYVDQHDINGYRIFKNDGEIAQCTTMTHTQTTSNNNAILKRNTCYTATIEYLKEEDSIKIRDIESMRYSYFESGKSFFGLHKISDAKMK